jgi:hypothetical protein
MATGIQKSVFVLLVAAAVAGRWISAGNLWRALGSSLVEIPVAIAAGRIALWFVDKLLLFVANARHPESTRSAFNRTLWQTLCISLVAGLPLWLLLSAS